MKENLKKVVFIIIGFFLTSLFFVNRAFAYTEIYSEDFDNYTPNSCISYQNGTFGNWKTDQSNICLSSTQYVSSPNSLLGTSDNTIYYDNFSLISGTDISAVFTYDAYLATNAQYELGLFDSSGNVVSTFGFGNLNNDSIFITSGDYNGSGWVSGSSEINSYLSSKLNSWVKISYVINIWYGYNETYETDLYNFHNYIYIDGEQVLNYSSFNYNSHVINKITIKGSGGTTNAYIDNFIISDTLPSSSIDGLCGSANGSTFDWADFDNQDFCSTGTYALNSISSGLITWDCEGSGGGTTESCSDNYYINGECGTANGGYFSTSPEVSTLCSSESYLILPSFVETSSGWTWICGGYYGGTQSYCSAYLTGTSYPSLPEEEDCSSYTIPDKWICEIKNIFNGAFLPSEAKLNELNIAINSFQTKAPFNYLSSASNILENVKNGISEDDLSITIMQNTSQVNLNDIEAFTSIIKTFFTILLMFAFLFWGINYIKHFFR